MEIIDIIDRKNKKSRFRKSEYNRQEPLKVPQDEKELTKALDEWSEGSSSLRKLLKLSNENGYLTFACCKGHENQPYPYISYVFNNNKKNIYFNEGNSNLDNTFYYILIAKMLEKGKKVILTNYSVKEKYAKRFAIYFKKEEAEEEFSNIQNILEEYLNEKCDEEKIDEIEKRYNIDKKILRMISYFLDNGDTYYIDMEILYDNNVLNIGKYKDQNFLDVGNYKYFKKVSEIEEDTHWVEDNKLIIAKTGRLIERYEMKISDVMNVLK